MPHGPIQWWLGTSVFMFSAFGGTWGYVSYHYLHAFYSTEMNCELILWYWKSGSSFYSYVRYMVAELFVMGCRSSRTGHMNYKSERPSSGSRQRPWVSGIGASSPTAICWSSLRLVLPTKYFEVASWWCEYICYILSARTKGIQNSNSGCGLCAEWGSKGGGITAQPWATTWAYWDPSTRGYLPKLL